MAKTIKDAVNEYIAKQAITALLKQLEGKAKVFEGYKTYIIAAILLILAGVRFAGFEVPFMTDNSDPGLMISMALGLIFNRQATKRVDNKL